MSASLAIVAEAPLKAAFQVSNRRWAYTLGAWCLLTSSERMVLMLSTLVPAGRMLDSLVGSKVNCVCRPCDMLCEPFCKFQCLQNLPAPITTLDTPRHNVRKPSSLVIVIMALDIPEYTAVGEGLATCMRVCVKPFVRTL